MAYVGVDLHVNRFTVNYKGNKESVRSASYYLDDVDIERFKQTLKKDDHVFVEASTNTFAFCDLIQKRVKKVVVIDPFRFRAIADSGKKTDKVDAGTLAKMGQYHVKSGGDFLPEVYVVAKPVRELRSLFTTYNLLRKEIIMTKNRIHSLFRQNLKLFGRDYRIAGLRSALAGFDLAAEDKLQIMVLLDILERLEDKIKEIKKAILRLGAAFREDIDLLVSINGVSVFIALGLISDYATITRFTNAKQFSKYLRSTPRSEVSNEKTKDGKTQRRGRKLSIRLILQGIHHYTEDSVYLNRFYQRLRKGKGACKARMAIARKLFVTIFYMLKMREYYRYMNKELHDRKMKEYQLFLKKEQRC